ncbi:type II toxin-antitoxin system death-on-curing family toxin [Acinetobacter baumannii]|uniref:type II toxin-antitoxin system death-on-curing family toxin n=1 Tax=Acinetobacter baumannii TaxID=470 RepID=UPI0023F2F4BF|nr:type II toxin-antitoxin system death-on-curing family toxin [Acinetobacter baumannii]MDF7837058.1 type II toxin-antitoxin system death-on-curing family toxin [Acinetobacter baumannii]HDX6034083.1 type II toxin-antitoxin system death-on-curing family toxin [Acinetobacter baumannii]
MYDPAPLINATLVEAIHSEILDSVEGGMRGPTNYGLLESALNRVQQYVYYDGLNDIYEIAAWYGISISTQHAFSDGDKRTGLTVMLTYLRMQGVYIEPNQDLDDMMVDIVQSAQSTEDGNHKEIAEALAEYLYRYVHQL